MGPPAKPAIEVSTDPATPANEVSTDPGWPPLPRRAPTASACTPYRELIELALARGRNAMAIWRDLVDDHGFPAQYASVRRFVRRRRGSRVPEAHPSIVTAPGEEGQVDYGEGPMVRHPGTGKYRRTRLFVFTLGYSRKSVRLLTFASSTRGWCELHEESFRRLGGTVQVVVLDNLREGVLTADIYDPALNPLYHDVLAHYGVVALPCRVGDPDRKGKVESAIGHTQAALKGLRFETLEAAQAYLDRWDARWADTRFHGTTKRQVAAMFVEERPALRPLPVEPFRYYQFGRRTVHLDNCIEVDAGYYSAPPGWLGQEVAVQWNASHVRLLDPRTGRLLREHRRHAKRGRHAIHPGDRPARTPPSTLSLLAQAARAGLHIGPLCAAIHRERLAHVAEAGLLLVSELLDEFEKDAQLRGLRSWARSKFHMAPVRVALGNWRARDLTSAAVDTYVERRLATKSRRSIPVASATVNRELAMLRGALGLALERGKLTALPKIRKLAERNVRAGFFERGEFEAVVTRLPDYLQDFTRFAHLTGWRRGELTSLRWADVDREGGVICLRAAQSKNGHGRTVAIEGDLKALMARRWDARQVKREDGTVRVVEYVFHHDGALVGDFRKARATACRAAGVSGRLFHDLRRSAIRNMVRAGVPRARGDGRLGASDEKRV